MGSPGNPNTVKANNSVGTQSCHYSPNTRKTQSELSCTPNNRFSTPQVSRSGSFLFDYVQPFCRWILGSSLPTQDVSAITDCTSPIPYRPAVCVEIACRDDKCRNINRLNSVHVYAGINVDYEGEILLIYTNQADGELGQLAASTGRGLCGLLGSRVRSTSGGVSV